jgi:hypothetical protein
MEVTSSRNLKYIIKGKTKYLELDLKRLTIMEFASMAWYFLFIVILFRAKR